MINIGIGDKALYKHEVEEVEWVSRDGHNDKSAMKFMYSVVVYSCIVNLLDQVLHLLQGGRWYWWNCTEKACKFYNDSNGFIL